MFEHLEYCLLLLYMCDININLFSKIHFLRYNTYTIFNVYFFTMYMYVCVDTCKSADLLVDMCLSMMCAHIGWVLATIGLCMCICCHCSATGCITIVALHNYCTCTLPVLMLFCG